MPILPREDSEEPEKVSHPSAIRNILLAVIAVILFALFAQTPVGKEFMDTNLQMLRNFTGIKP